MERVGTFLQEKNGEIFNKSEIGLYNDDSFIGNRSGTH